MARFLLLTKGLVKSSRKSAVPSFKQTGLCSEPGSILFGRRPYFYTNSAATRAEAINADLNARVNAPAGSQAESSEGRDSSGGCSWWAPHPSTGVWVPEGQELQTHSHDSEDHQKPWFREDVHVGYSSVDQISA